MENNKLNKLKGKWIYILDILAVILIIFTVVNIFLLYYWFVFDSENHWSDIPDHIAGALNGKSSYSLNAFVYRVMINFFDSEAPVVIWLFFFVMATSVLVSYVAYRYFGKPGRKYIPLFGVLGLVPYFIGSIYIPGIYEWHHRNTMTTTVWHNSTLIEMKFFGMITLLIFYALMKDIRENMQTKNNVLTKKWLGIWIAFVIMLFVTVGFKTNFYISFCPAAGVLLIIYFVKSIKEHNKTVTIQTLMTGISILAVLPVLYYQSSVLFDSGEDANHIIVSVGTVYLLYAANVVLKTLLSVLPFVSVLIYSIYKKNVSKEYMFLLTLWIIDIAVFFIFAESGSRMGHGNFSWGYKFSMYCLNTVSLFMYCKYVMDVIKNRKEPKRKRDIVMLAVIGLVFIASIASGILYFYKIAWECMTAYAI